MISEEYCEIFKALSHPIRLSIVCGLLKKGKCNVNTMSQRLNLSQSLISQHVNILKKAKIVKGYREKNIIWYKIENELTIKLLKNIDLGLCSK